MKRKKIFIKVLIVLLISFNLIYLPKPAKAEGTWWDEATIALEATSDPKIIDVTVNPAPPNHDVGFRLKVGSYQTTTQVANLGLAKASPSVEYNSEANCRKEPYIKVNEIFVLDLQADVSGKTYKLTQKDSSDFQHFTLTDYDPPTAGESKTYQLDFHVLRNCGGILGPFAYMGAKNIGTYENNPNQGGSPEDRLAKLRQINTLYKEWRDYVIGNCDVTPKIDPFLMPETPDCNNELSNPPPPAQAPASGKTNYFWYEESGAHVVGRIYGSEVVAKITKGLFGDKNPEESTNFYLTPQGETRYQQIKDRANTMADIIGELDTMNVTKEDVQAAKVLKRYWDKDLDGDENNPANNKIFQYWEGPIDDPDKVGLKTKIMAMVDLFNQAVSNLTGEEKGTCMNALTAGNIQIIYFIGCLFNSLGDFLIDTATKFFLNFGGL